ncbi:MAG: MFS transporter [Thiohalospira sp.]
MFRLAYSIYSLLLGIGLLLVGGGLLGTALGVRASMDGVSQTTIGFIMASYFAGFIVGTYGAPGIVRRVGHVRAFAAFAAVGSTTGILHAMFTDPLAWMALRLLTGASFVGIYMVIESWLGEQSTSTTRGRVFALYMTITLLALAGGQFLILVGDVGTFVPFGVVTILVSLALVPVALTRLREPIPLEAPILGLRHLIGISPLGVAGAFFSGLAYAAFWGMGPVFASGIGLDKMGVATFMAATILGGALLQVPIGHLSDQLDRRTVIAWVGVVGSLLALGLFAATFFGRGAIVVAAFLYGGVMFTAYGLAVAHMNDHLHEGGVLEATQALLLVHGGGAVVGPLVAGFMMEQFGAQALLFFFAAILALLAAYAFRRMHVSPTIPLEDQGDYVPMVRTSQAAAELDPRADEAELAYDAEVEEEALDEGEDAEEGGEPAGGRA